MKKKSINKMSTYPSNSNNKQKQQTQRKKGPSHSSKSHKTPGNHATNIPAFFQKNYGIKSLNIMDKVIPKLITTHKSYYPSQKRVIVIGDIHGDLDKLVDCLILSKCVKMPGPLPPQGQRTNINMYTFFNGIEWIGDRTFIVQLGDQIDRIRPNALDENNLATNKAFEDEGSSLHIFYLLWYLNLLAHAHGGRVISVIGNHEFMNINGDFRYVSPHEFKEYFDAFHRFYDGTYANTHQYEDKDLIETVKQETSQLSNIPAGYMERRIAFNPSGLIANFIGVNYKLCIQIGKWLFVHAGLTPNLCQAPLCSINNAISRYLIQGNQNTMSPAHNLSGVTDSIIYNRYVNNNNENQSPVWSREFGVNIEGEREERKLTAKYNMLIKDYNRANQHYHTERGIPVAEYLAIGHSPQFWYGKNINSICNDKIWRCDVGMSRAFLDEKDALNDTALHVRLPMVLEILNDTVINKLC